MALVMKTMSSRSRRLDLSKRPIHSIKHVLDNQGGLTIDTQTLIALIDTTDNPVLGGVIDIAVGAHVNSFFLNVQVAATSTASIANVYMFVYGNPGNNIPVGSIPKGNVVGASDFKKQIFHQEMIMTEKNTTAIPRTLFKGVIRIPKKFRRFGHDDTVGIALFSPGVTYDYCLQCIYKEYR